MSVVQEDSSRFVFFKTNATEFLLYFAFSAMCVCVGGYSLRLYAHTKKLCRKVYDNINLTIRQN